MSEMILRIDAELEARGWSRAELARHLGYSEQRLMNWWKRGIPASEHARVAKVLDWSVDRLLTGRPQAGGNTTQTKSDDELVSLIAAATPRSRSALEHIAAAAAKGDLSDADLTMLEQIAMRFLGNKSAPAANASHEKLRKRLRNDDTPTKTDGV